MGASDNNDLKSQLSDIQKRLSEATFNTPKRGSSLRKEQNVQFPTKSSSASSTPDSLSTAPKKAGELATKKSLPSFLSKKDKRVSLPVLESSRSPTTKNNGKDMDFVVGLSENLLIECRRLQAENQQKSSKLRALEEEFSKIRNSNNGLMTKLNEVLQNEEKYKDTNWELELKLQQITQEYKNVSENYDKAQKELNKQKDLSDDIRTELEEINLDKVTLEKELNTNKTSVTQEIQSLKEHVDELNDVNYRLNDEIEELRKDLEAAKSKPKPAPFAAIPSLQPQNDSDSDEDFNEPPISPVKTIPINNTALETETLKSSLSTAHQTISKLRKQILKLRENELSNKTQSPASKKPQTPITSRKLRLNELPARLGPNSTRSSRIVIDDDSENDDEWENFEADDSSISYSTMAHSPSRKARGRPVSLYSNVSTNNELIDDSDSDVDDSENYPVAPLSSELHRITQEDVEKYAKDNSLVLLPLNEYENLSGEERGKDAVLTLAESGIIALPNDDQKAKVLTEAELIAHAKEKGLTILTPDDLDVRVQEIEQLTGKITVLESNEQKYFREAEEYRQKLESALAEAKKENQVVKDLRAQLDTPSESYIKEKAIATGLALVPVATYEALQSEISNLRQHVTDPSEDYLHKKASSKDLKVLPSAEHSGLLAQIGSLEGLVSQHETDKEELYSKLSNISSTHEKALKDHETTLESLSKESECKVIGLTEELAVLKEENAELAKSLESLKIQDVEHTKELEQAKNHEGELIKSLEAVSAASAVLTTELESFKVKHAKLSEELEQFKSTASGLKSEMETLKDTNAVNVARLAEEAKYKAELQRLIDEPSADYIKEKASAIGFTALTLAELDVLNNSISSLKDELSSTIATSAKKEESASESIIRLKSRIEEPQTSYLKEKAGAKGFKLLEITAYEEELTELNSQITSLQEEIKLNKEQFAKKSEISSTIIDELKANLETAQTERVELNESLTKLKQQLDSSHGEISILKNQIDNPTHDYLHERSAAQGLTILPNLEHAALVEKSNRTVHDLAKEGNHVVLDDLVHRELVEKATKPSIVHLVSSAKSHNHTVIPVAHYDDLVAKSKKTLEDHAKEQNCVLLGQDEHKELIRKSEAPTINEIAAHAKLHSYAAIHDDELSELKAKASRTVEDLANENDLVLVRSQDHAELTRKATEPSVEELSKLVATKNHVIVPKSDYEDLSSKASKTVEERARESNFKLLSIDDHKELVRKANSPTVTEVGAMAAALGLVTVASKEHDDLVAKSNRTVLDLAKAGNSVVLSETEHKELLKKLEAPNIDYLTSKANTLEHKVVPTTEYSNLVRKGQRSAEDLAKEEKLVLLTPEEHENLVNPSVASIISKAEKAGLIAIPLREHGELVNKVQAPDLEHLSTKAKLLGYVVIPATDYKELSETATAPSKEFIAKNAETHGLVAIPVDVHHSHKEELSKLKKQLTDSALLMERVSSEGNVVLKQADYDDLVKKSSVSVEDLAKANNMVVLDTEAHESLMNPTKEKIINIASKHGLVAVASEEYQTLIRNNEAPTIDYLKEKSAPYGYVVVTKESYDSLKHEIDSPTADYLAQHAKKLNATVVPNEKLSELKTKASRTADDLAKEEQKVLLSKSYLESLKNPDKDTLVAKATALGLVPLTKEEHASLMKQIDSPDMEYIQQKASGHSYTAIHNDELKELEAIKSSPTAEFLADKAKSLQLALLPAAELSELKSRASKPIEELAKEKKLVVVPEEEHKSLLSPSRDTLLKAVTGLGLITLGSAEHAKLVKPSSADIERHAKSLNSVVVSKSHYQELSNKSKRSVEDLAKESNLHLLTADEHKKLLEPSTDKLIELASAAGLVAVSSAEYDSLVNPTYETLKTQAAKQSLTLVQVDEFEQLKKQASKTIEVLARESDSVLLSKDDHDKLVNPDKNTVVSHAAQHGLITLTRDDHHLLNNPSKDILQSHAERNGLKLLQAADYDSLLNPPKDVLEEHAIRNKSVLLSKGDHESLLNPTKEVLREHAERLGAVLLEEDAYNQLAHPSKEALKKLAKSQNLIVLDTDFYEELQTTVDNPSTEFLSKHAEGRDLVIIEKSKFDDLVNKSEVTVEDLAKKQNSVVLPLEELTSLRSPSAEVIRSHASRLGLVAVEKAKFEDISARAERSAEELAAEKDATVVPVKELRLLEEPSFESIQTHASRHGHVTVEKVKFDELTARASKSVDDLAEEANAVVVSKADYELLHAPSLESIQEYADKHDHVIVEKAEFESLNTRATKTVDELAEERSAIVVPKEEYRSLKFPSIEFIQDHAANHGFITINAKEKETFIDNHLTTKNLVPIAADEYETMKTGEFLSKDDVTKLCDKHGLKTVDYQAPIHISEEELEKQAQKVGLVAVPREDYDLLKAQAENPDRVTIEKHAALIGCTILSTKEYETLQNAANKISKTDLESKALKIDHVLIPKVEYDQLNGSSNIEEEPSTPTTKFEATKHYFENVSKSGEKDLQRAKVFDSARSLGFVPVSAEEYKQLIENQKEHVITKADIYKSAREMNLSVLPQEDYKSLLKDRVSKDHISLDELHELAARFQMKLVPFNYVHDANTSRAPLTINANQSVSTFQSTINEDEFEDALSRVPSDASTIHGAELESSVHQLQSHSVPLGDSVVPITSELQLEDDNDTNGEGETNNDTIVIRNDTEDITRRASDLGLVVLSKNDYDELATFDKFKVESRAQELGLRVFSAEEAAELESWRVPQESQLRTYAEKLGLVLLTNGQVAVSKMGAEDAITAETIGESAKSLGLVVLSHEDYETLKKDSSSTANPEKLALAASTLGLSVVSVKELADLKSGPKDVAGTLAKEGKVSITTSEYDALVTKAKDIDSDDFMNSKLREKGLVTIPSDEYEELKAKELTEEEITQRASDLGLVTIPFEDFQSLAVQPEIRKEDVVSRASEFGLTVIANEEYEKLLSKPEATQENVLEKSGDLGSVVYPGENVPSSTKVNTPLLSGSDVVQRALDLDMVAVTKQELAELREKAGNKTEEEAKEEQNELEYSDDECLPLTKEQVEAGAKNHGLLVIPENAFVATNVSRIPDANNVVVLPVTYYNKLTKSEVFSIDHITNDELQAQAKKRGFHVVFGEPEFKEPLSVTRKNTITSIKSSNSRKSIADLALSSASLEYENTSVRNSRSSSRAHSRAGSRSGSVNPPASRNFSIDGGISLVTDASLSEPKIIPALTQAVIGEYVYKYYRRLGPFSSISESRHERYFWIHPYTLTLYWSSTNPVLGNPSTHKTRAAAIVGVESVDDNNPLPTGLYHKSIVVHSQTRSVKFTCSTRQRHNIWYNSLRYLIQRSMDGIDMDEDFDDLMRIN